jgi:hypothetical protein
MVWAVVVFTVVAPEGEVNFDPALLASQTLGAPGTLNIWLLLTFNVGTPEYQHFELGKAIWGECRGHIR